MADKSEYNEIGLQFDTTAEEPVKESEIAVEVVSTKKRLTCWLDVIDN